jgi:hypothetical protein
MKHSAHVTMEMLAGIGGTPVEHTPHSLDLGLCDFWAFQMLEHELQR